MLPKSNIFRKYGSFWLWKIKFGCDFCQKKLENFIKYQLSNLFVFVFVFVFFVKIRSNDPICSAIYLLTSPQVQKYLPEKVEGPPDLCTNQYIYIYAHNSILHIQFVRQHQLNYPCDRNVVLKWFVVKMLQIKCR